ncbi:sensor domain-containing phosphodiesterase [Pseudoxanthomonas japonensis]|uniref:sensor domain-containing phosphodiesterase n=1 Tax=Pseudoxanthomonas japonensis TaxID=69284 RepID=UPI001BCB5E10|nr:EAL domain-containing protein [Pseudoxanthomonas japonensis]
MAHRAAVLDRIVEAVCYERIQPFFQPIVHLRSMQTVGFEVLARWTDEQLGSVAPDEFIGAAHSKSLLPVLTYNLIRTACLAAVHWPHHFFLAFNVPPSLLQDPLAMGLITDAISESGFAFDRVRVEITEVELIEDEDGARHAVKTLNELGIKVVLDDFGTGFSSLVRLSAFDFDEIKIDGSFVKRMTVDADSRKIVSAVVGLGHSLDIAVVAEAVETEEQADLLRRLGCEFGQGWWLGRPVPAESAVDFLNSLGAVGTVTSRLHLSPYHRQNQLEALYASAPLGLCFIDSSMRCLAANDAFCRMIGKRPDEVMGRTVSEVYDTEDVSLMGAAIERLMLNGKEEPPEVQFPGSRETYLVYPHPVTDEAGSPIGLSIVSMDITQRKKAEQALNEREEQYRKTVEFSPTVHWRAEVDGTISYIGPLPDEPERSGLDERMKSWYSRVDPLDRERVLAEWIAWVPSGEPFEAIFKVQWPLGHWRHVRSQARPHREDGRIVKWYGTFTDITREAALERQVANQRAFPDES